MPDKLKWSTRSIREYDHLIDYLTTHWNEDIALRVMLEIDQTIINIKNTPEHYPIFLKRNKIRRCVASPQTSIFFKHNHNEIEIVTIFDNRQNPKKLKL